MAVEGLWHVVVPGDRDPRRLQVRQHLVDGRKRGGAAITRQVTREDCEVGAGGVGPVDRPLQ